MSDDLKIEIRPKKRYYSEFETVRILFEENKVDFVNEDWKNNYEENFKKSKADQDTVNNGDVRVPYKTFDGRIVEAQTLISLSQNGPYKLKVEKIIKFKGPAVSNDFEQKAIDLLFQHILSDCDYVHLVENRLMDFGFRNKTMDSATIENDQWAFGQMSSFSYREGVRNFAMTSKTVAGILKYLKSDGCMIFLALKDEKPYRIWFIPSDNDEIAYLEKRLFEFGDSEISFRLTGKSEKVGTIRQAFEKYKYELDQKDELERFRQDVDFWMKSCQRKNLDFLNDDLSHIPGFNNQKEQLCFNVVRSLLPIEKFEISRLNYGPVDYVIKRKSDERQVKIQAKLAYSKQQKNSENYKAYSCGTSTSKRNYAEFNDFWIIQFPSDHDLKYQQFETEMQNPEVQDKIMKSLDRIMIIPMKNASKNPLLKCEKITFCESSKKWNQYIFDVSKGEIKSSIETALFPE